MAETFDEGVVLFLDGYGAESENLHKSFLLAGKNYPTIVIDEDGFLPEGVMSVFGYFLGDFPKGQGIPGRPRYFNEIKVPPYWEISASNTKGKVQDLNHERAGIFYAEPRHKRHVKAVDWYNEKGIVRSSDHYNRQGALYARTIFNAKGQKVNKAYFDVKGREIIVENFVTGNIILNEDGNVRIFQNKTDFVLYFMERTGFARRRMFFNSLATPFFVSLRLAPSAFDRDLLFWQEPERGDIPGNMQLIFDNSNLRVGKVLVQKAAAYQRLLSLGAPDEKLGQLGYVYPFARENQGRRDALICTNSDNVAKLKELVEGLPELHFHVAAITEMSSKLMAMERYENVTLYPGAKNAKLDDLFAKCDYYLDINHENEIVSAVKHAFLENQLIFAFRETMHNPDYVAKERIYAKVEAERMIADIRGVLENDAARADALDAQRQMALAEGREAYEGL